MPFVKTNKQRDFPFLNFVTFVNCSFVFIANFIVNNDRIVRPDFYNENGRSLVALVYQRNRTIYVLFEES